ncbi:MAG TPA: class I SAM-dependent methyltransferase [Candidatus Pacearchaeota archaeon]|nr:class I SAM-dependent methyltransferase [Candidatus Pacearchaeota archaeon]HOK94310.1 class I SAM-dependent methyltransferase [Candidatus Pacearchaeota archaeon]HPO75334.1 class I SAM-dependent methyltransferase [Candidatus Pacearchaeota archaeon]
MAKQWDRIFQKEGKVFLRPQPDLPKIVNFFIQKGVRKILDLGCGTGRHLVYLAKKGFDVYGIDNSENGIKIAKNWLKKENLKAHFKISDIYKTLPYKNDFFDAVISTQALHHNKIENIRKLIKEIERILKPKGLIFVTLREELSIRNWQKNKIVLHKYKNGNQTKTTKYKIIGYRMYTPIEGGEKGLIHFCFNRELIKKEFKNFKILNIWRREGQYCFIGELK